jgi:small subunit ribosomal protein S4e
MTRGPKKHLKRLAAPNHWMLDKMGGVFAPRPRAGPHKLRECVPLIVVIRNRLKYAVNGKEARTIMMERNIKVDGRVRTDIKYPAGFMDCITIDKTNENYRLMYDVKGRFTLVPIDKNEAKTKLLQVTREDYGNKATPKVTTHDGRTIRYPDPDAKVYDTVKYNVETGKITEVVKFDVGNVAMIKGGQNIGRVGIITARERHLGAFDIVHIKDARGNTFCTRISNVFVIGKGSKPAVKLPRGNGIMRTILEEQTDRY